MSLRSSSAPRAPAHPSYGSRINLLLLGGLAACFVAQRASSQTAGQQGTSAAVEGPVRIEALDASDEPPTFVMRGGPRGASRIVFLHGMCGHALGYAQSFQFAAAKKGALIAPQGDRRCGEGPWASWSNDLEALDDRIARAFRALDPEPPTDIVVIGYSQGATRAEALARRWPERYTRLVLIAAPQAASPRGLSSVRGAVMMAGERDRHDLMKKGSRALAAANIPSTFMVIPEATHGSMGPTPEETMGKALDWLWDNERRRAER